MRNKIISLALMFAFAIVILPPSNYSATPSSVTTNEFSPQKAKGQVKGKRGKQKNLNAYWNRRHDNGKHKGWYKGRHKGWDSRQYARRSRLVKRTYWYQGHQRIRYVRVYF